jgi:hypothetical protein
MTRPAHLAPGPSCRAVNLVLASAALLAAALAFGCASDGRNTYEPPPNDGSANANSSDVVTEPPITPR